VKLEVFDITGKKVAELVNTNSAVGHYKAVFEPKNLAAGVYFYRLKVGNSTTIKKMIYLK
jgi:hypothetical protein